MKICSDCKASIPDEYVYCLNCGRFTGAPTEQLKDEPPPTIPYQGRQTAHTPQPTRARASRLPLVIVLLFGATILVLSIVIGLQRRRSSETPASTQASAAASPQLSTAAAPLPAAVTSASTASTPGTGTISTKPKIESPASTTNSSSTPDPNRVYTGTEVSEKARVMSKPKPSYTEEARQNQIAGTVVLKVVFSAGGTVENIKVVSGLPYGLTERAIDAARSIRFTPAMKDGVAVSMWMQVEYNFNLY